MVLVNKKVIFHPMPISREKKITIMNSRPSLSIGLLKFPHLFFLRRSRMLHIRSLSECSGLDGNLNVHISLLNDSQL